MPLSTDPTLGASCPGCNAQLPPGSSLCPQCEETQVDRKHGEDPRPSVQRRVAGYRILQQLGSGGMGTVFEAEDEKMQRRVALKVLSGHLGLSDKAERRFEREAWIAGKLDHPNLVKVFERGSCDGLSYYSMELVRGGSLHDVIRNMKATGRDDRLGLIFGSREYVYWAIQQVIETARGLDFAHKRGVVHRDIKPMNLMLSEDLGIVKITDFGIAIDTEGPRTTTEGKLMGTLAYMAPEQVLGKQREITARTDIYALGVTLFELLTLELPFEGKTQELYLNAVLTSEARRASKINSRVGRDLEIVIRKTLEKEPRDRYMTAAAFAEDLENVLHLRPIQARPPGWGSRTLKWTRRKPIHALLTALLLFGVPVMIYLANRSIEHRRMVVRSQVDQLWNEIRWLSQKTRNREVVVQASELLALDPGHVYGLRSRAIAHANLAGSEPESGHERLSIEDTDRIIELLPSGAWPYRLKAFLLNRFGRSPETVPVLVEADRRRAGSPSNDDLYFDGLLALEEMEYQTALQLFTRLSVQRPNDPLTFHQMGLANRGLGRLDEAVKNYRWALALNPDEYYTHLELGLLLTETGVLDEGMGHLRRALELDASKSAIHYALAVSLLKQGLGIAGDGAASIKLFREAEAEARASLAIEPGAPWSLVTLGSSLLERNRLLETPDPRLLEEARDCYRDIRSWKEDPGAYGAGLTNLCDTLIQLRQFDRALEVCGEITVLEPDAADGWYNMAGIHAQMNRPAEALAALARDVELGDNDWQYMAADPWFQSLSGDPRFRELLDRMRRAGEAKLEK